mmetsp:Transcript_82094/g.120357  ORF Transcript_82094/g.120357 Transcript_82094/m.120357 type:complete len:207 (-) Transcript_82094:143-763(-)
MYLHSGHILGQTLGLLIAGTPFIYSLLVHNRILRRSGENHHAQHRQVVPLPLFSQLSFRHCILKGGVCALRNDKIRIQQARLFSNFVQHGCIVLLPAVSQEQALAHHIPIHGCLHLLPMDQHQRVGMQRHLKRLLHGRIHLLPLDQHQRVCMKRHLNRLVAHCLGERRHKYAHIVASLQVVRILRRHPACPTHRTWPADGLAASCA